MCFVPPAGLMLALLAIVAQHEEDLLCADLAYD